MVRKSIAIVALMLLIVAAGVQAAGPGRYAVVVGINDYADAAIPDLKYAESDAKAVYDTLIDAKIGRFPKDNVTLLLGKNVTPGKIKAALYKLRGVGKDDLVVIFYSGHGAKEGDEAFWVTQDADRKALPATSLTNSEIRKYFQKIPSQRMVVLLDCCYAASTVKKSLADPKKLFGEFEGKGRVTIAGSADNQEALEYPDKKAGVFTHYLVGGLRGAADVNTDGVVTFEEMWGYLGDNVRKASVKQGGLHEPVLISEGGLTPQFLLTFNPTVQAASIKSVQTLRKLFAEDKITGAQFDLGRKALSAPALNAVAKARREVFASLAAGKLEPKFLADILASRIKKAGGSSRPPVGTGKKPTLAVVPFTVYGDAKAKDAGAMVAEQLLPRFAPDYELIDIAQLKRFLEQDNLEMSELMVVASGHKATKGLSKAVRLRGVRYLVVGTLSCFPDGGLSITARICDWQTGSVLTGRVGQIGGDTWGQLRGRLPYLAGKLTGRTSVKLQPPQIYAKWPFDAKEAVKRQDETAKALGAKKALTLDLGKGETLKLTLIPAGKFQMGSPKTETGRFDDEGPQREVTLSKPFYMGIYEITQSQWKAVMGTEPCDGKTFAKSGASNPATYISWDDASKFCETLSKKTGKKVTLPTEAQWEYSCRGGGKTPYYFGDDASSLGEYAWYHENTFKKDELYPHVVGQKKVNAFGLYDMHGNVWEWCRDGYDEKFYANAKNVDPENTTEAKYRVLRGGSWELSSVRCRAANRSRYSTDYRYYGLGFRVVVVSGLGVD